MKPVKEKNLPLAIGLNLALPGLGYIYMGKKVVGILACLLILGIYLTTPIAFIGLAWVSMNIILVVDMLILSNKNKKKLIEQNMKKCPECAESIQKEARVCRFCNAKLEAA